MAGSIGLKAIFTADDRVTGKVAGMQAAVIGFTSSAGKGLGKLDAINSKIWGGAKTAALATAGVGAAIGLGAWDVVSSAATIEDSLAKVASVVTPMSGTVVDATSRMKSAAIGWSKAHRDSATSFLDSTYMMLSAGLNERAAIEATRTAMTVATATFGEGAAAAGLIATVYNNMGDKTRDVGMEMSRLGDVITKTQQTFQFANLDQLTEGLKFGIPTALQYGISIDALSTIVGELNNAGLQGSMAGTAFTATMRSMTSGAQALGFAIAKTSTGGFDFGGTLHNIEGKFGSLSKMSDQTRQRFQKAFGDEGFRALSLMIGKSDELKDKLQKVHDSTGVSKDAASGIESKGTNRFKILGNNIEALKAGIGDGLSPAVDKVIGKLFGVTDATGEWADKNKDLVSTNVTKFIDDAIPAIENFAHQLKEGWHDVAPILRGVGKALSWAKDHGLSDNIVKIGLGFAAFSSATKAVHGGVFLIDSATKATKVVTWMWDLGKSTKAATDALRIAQQVGPSSILAMSNALNGMSGELGNVAGSAGRVAGARGALNAAFDGWAAKAGLAAVAIGAIWFAMDQGSKFLDENGGWEGVAAFLGAGPDSEFGFDAVDAMFDRKAKAQADWDAKPLAPLTPQQQRAAAFLGMPAADAPGGYANAFGAPPPRAPGPYADGYVAPGMAPPAAAPPPALARQAPTADEMRAMVAQELTVKLMTEPGTTAEVVGKPPGAKVKLQPSGGFY